MVRRNDSVCALLKCHKKNDWKAVQSPIWTITAWCYNLYSLFLGPTYYISQIHVFRDEVDLVCERVNGTHVEITTEAKFNTVSTAIIQWINESPKVKQAFYGLRLNFRFWISTVYDHQVYLCIFFVLVLLIKWPVIPLSQGSLRKSGYGDEIFGVVS